MPDTGAAASSDAAPVLAPDVEVRILLIAGKSLQLLEGPPVLHDRRDAHLVGEQSLLRVVDQIVEHVLHPSPASEVQEAAREPELVVEPRADQENDEIAVDLGRHPPASHLTHEHHPPSTACGRS
jgi:hypothetical protein